jgi:O-antigen/teichoic acid export membrane protein
MELMNFYGLLGLSGALLQVLVVVLPFGGLIDLAIGLFFVQVVIAVLAGIVCTLQIPAFWQAWHFSGRALKTLVYASAPIALLALLGILYQKLSIYMLSAFAGAMLTGLFAAVLRVVEASKIIHVSVFTALYPAMARSGDSFWLIQISLLAGGALIALTLSMLAAPLVSLFFGADFSPSIPILRILAWMLVPYTVNTYLTLTFVAAKQERNVTIALSASLPLLFLLNLWWIPRFGLAGAAWAALTAESSQALLLLAQYGFQIDIARRGRGGASEFPKLP